MHPPRDLFSPDALLADSKWLRSLARGMVGDASADDIVQDTWLSTLRRPPRFLNNLRPWLRTVARNLAIRDRDRTQGRQRLEESVARNERQPSTIDVVARATLRQFVVDAVLHLEEPYRTSILLRYFEGMAPRNIARLQGIPVATVHTHVRRGLQLLRSRLDKDCGGRQAWVTLLIPAPAMVGSGALSGAIVMGTKVKAVCVAAAVLLCVGAWGWHLESQAASEVPTPTGAQVARDRPEPESAPVTPATADSRSIVATPYTEEPDKEFAITGIAVDDRNGNPVERVTARLISWSQDGDVESAPIESLTNPEGRFRVPIAQKNRVRGLTLLSPEFAPLVVDHIENDVMKAIGEAIDLGILRLLRGARVTGRVVSADSGAPIADAALFLAPRGYLTQLLLSEARPVGRSGRDGSFALTERAPPHGNQEEILAAVSKQGVGWTFLSIVKDRETLDGVEIAIAPGAALRVTVVDVEDRPVNGALIYAVPRFPPLGPPAYFGPNYANGWLPIDRRSHFAGKTDPDGVLALPGLPIGREDERFRQYPTSKTAYDVMAYHVDFSVGAPQSVSLDLANETTARIKLVRRRFSTIQGHVISESGEPIPGAHVKHTGEAAFVTTDQDGVYRFKDRDNAQGKAFLEVRAAGFAMAYREVPLSVGGDEVSADFVLLRSTPIEGRVVDQDGHPVPGAYVDILKGGSAADRKQHRPDGGGDLDMEGRFVFSDATEGIWELRVFAPKPSEEWGATRSLKVHGGDKNVEVVLRHRPPARARLEATIVDVSGTPVDPAEAFIRKAARMFSGDSVPHVKAQIAVGRVTAEKIWPGTYTMTVRLTDGSRANREFVVTPEDTVVRLSLEIGRPGVVTVRVDLSGIPEASRPSSIAIFTTPNDAVQWVSPPGQPAPKATRGFGIAESAKDWTVRFEDVMPNVPIRFRTMSSAGIYGESNVSVGFGEAKEVVLRPTAGARVTFRKLEQAPGCGIAIFLKRADGSWEEAWSDTWETGKAWSWGRETLSGHLSWRAERYALESDPEDRRVTAVIEGDLDLATGEIRDIPLVFP